MRILHISTRLILGGSQENTVLSCEGQARRGHDVHLAFGPIYGPEGSLLERVQNFRADNCRGITTHVIPHMIREVNPRADRRAYHELRQLIGSLTPDIVHTHSSKAGILGRAAAYSVFKQIAVEEIRREEKATGMQLRWMFVPHRIIHTIHGPPFMPVEGSPFARARTRINNTIYTFAERYAAKRCGTIISVADAMTRQFLARGIGRPEQYTTIYSGMEVENFLTPAPGQTREAMRAQLGFSDDDIVIGTIARLAQHKGHDDLLDALADSLKQRPNLKLLWIGDGWWRERLIARARALGLAVRELDRAGEEENKRRGEEERSEESRERPGAPPDSKSPSHATPSPSQILVTGLIPPDNIPGHIRAMDILAHPSYREGLPRTIPQALLSGIVPVAYDIDGTGEVCRDRETGRLVRAADIRDLREAILDLADHPAERERLAGAGREWCRERFSAETMVEQLEQVYERALAPGPRASMRLSPPT